jgi:hypothetical protein
VVGGQRERRPTACFFSRTRIVDDIVRQWPWWRWSEADSAELRISVFRCAVFDNQPKSDRGSLPLSSLPSVVAAIGLSAAPTQPCSPYREAHCVPRVVYDRRFTSVNRDALLATARAPIPPTTRARAADRVGRTNRLAYVDRVL